MTETRKRARNRENLASGGRDAAKTVFLCDKYGIYARVKRRMGRSASTVSKYIKLKRTPKTAALTLRNNVRR